MAGMIEVAKATVTIVPNMEGAQKTITSDLTGVAETAGDKAGQAAGGKMAKGIGKAIVGTAVAAKIGKGIADSWKEVDAAMDTVATKTGATGAALESLQDSAKKVATALPTSFEAAGDAVGEVNTKFGTTGKELESLSAQFIKFAAINDTDVTSSVDTVANTLAAFGEDASHASSVLDAMTVAGQASGISMEELGSALQKNATAFSELGLSVEDAAGLMATFNTAGLTTADTSAALRTAWKVAAKDGMSLNEAIAEFGKTMDSSADATEKQQAAIELFGGRAGGAIYNAFANGKISIEDFLSSMSGFSGAVSTTFENTLDPTDRFQQAMNGLKTIGAELVEALAPALTTLADTLVPMISKAAEAFGNLPDGAKTAIVAFAGLTAVAGPVASIGGKIASGFSGLAGHFANAASGAASAAGGLTTVGSSAASAASGATSAASGFAGMAGSALQIVALGAGFALAGLGLKQIAEGAVAIGQGGAPAGIALAGLIVSLGALMALTAALGPALTAGALGIAAFGAAMLAIGAGIDLACSGIAKLTEAFGNLLVKAAESADGLSQIIGSVGQAIEGIISSIGGAIANVLDSVAGIIDSIGTSAVNCGEGMKLMAEGIGAIVALNLIDLGASMTAVSAGIGKMAKHSEEITATSTSIVALGNELNTFGVMAQTVSQNIATAMTAAFTAVKSNLDAMSQAFKDTVLEFSPIKLPHFSMSGKFDAQSGSVPTVNVDWYAKAAERGAVFSSPTLIGAGDANQPEMLLGENTLYDNLRQAVSESVGDTYVYIGDTQLDAIIQRSNARSSLRSGR